jgi:hypothetical protein
LIPDKKVHGYIVKYYIVSGYTWMSE